VEKHQHFRENIENGPFEVEPEIEDEDYLDPREVATPF
jgi:hypothetical protein